MIADLHTHTNYSDGQLYPDELVRKAKESGVEALSITDHDTVDGLRAGHMEAQRLGIKFIPGIELTCRCESNGMGIHMLGLGMDYTDPYILKKLEHVKKDRKKRASKIIDMLETYEWIVDPFIFENTKGVLTTYDIARSVVNKNIPTAEFYDRWLSECSPCFIEMETFAIEEAIGLIHRAGGKAICAHLTRTLNESGRTDGLKHVAKDLIKRGIDGFEVFYSLNTREEVQSVLDITKEHGLLRTGGSDFHGHARSGRCPLGGHMTYGLDKKDQWIMESANERHNIVRYAVAQS